MVKVHLYGSLAEEFGAEHSYKVSSPAEACRALEANNPGKFYTAIREGSYTIFRGDLQDEDTDTEATLTLQRPDTDIHIVPQVSGAKSRGIGQIITGVIIIAAAVVYAYYTGDYTSAFAAAEGVIAGGAGSTMAMMGAAMVVSGIATMLTPVPSLDGGELGKSVDDKKSFIFTGPENVSTQGIPVPLVYGRFKVGSVVVSRSLTVENI